MFIIHTQKGDIKADSDEIAKVLSSPRGSLVMLRNGVVNTTYIINIVEDVERKAAVLKLVGETDEDVQRRIDAERSVDIFESVRETILKLHD